MSMPLGGSSGPRSFHRRVDSLSRDRDSIIRILDQAEFDTVRYGLESLKTKLDSIEERLSGR